jgi:hypothetical protein
MQRVRILLAALPPIVIGIIKDIVAEHDDLGIAGEVATSENLARDAAAVCADVVIVGTAETSDGNAFAEQLFRSPRLKIVAIAPERGLGFLHDLQPRTIALGEISPAELVAAIRTASGSGAGQRAAAIER